MKNLQTRVNKLERNTGAGGLHAVDVFPKRGEGAEAALARTVKELGITEVQIGYATLWPDPDGNGPITTLIDRVGGQTAGLVGHVSHEDALAELLK